MEKILYNLNANFVALLLNGFVGEIHISVNHVIKSNVTVIMSVSTQNRSYQFAQALKIVQ
jgi:hypothetical protein